jgi:hypothetical protein
MPDPDSPMREDGTYEASDEERKAAANWSAQDDDS